MNNIKHYTDKELINELYRFVKENGRIPKANDMKNSNGYISIKQYITRFKTWNNALEIAGLIKRIDYTKDIVIQMLKDFHIKYNRSPTKLDIENSSELPSMYIINKFFNTLNDALITSGLSVNKLQNPLTGNEICYICKSSKTYQNWYYQNNLRICSKCYNQSRNHLHGILDPNSKTGIGVLTENVVYTVLNDCVKCNTIENFNNKYDLISEKYGTINVKSAILRNMNINTYNWHFNKNINAYIPNTYICLGFNENRTEILHVWIIPGNCNLVKRHGINISLHNLERVTQYEIDVMPYDKVYKNLNIYILPEFCNLLTSEVL